MSRRPWIILTMLAILTVSAVAAVPPMVRFAKNVLVVYQPPYRAASLVAPVSACTIATYTGADSLLYSDRDYRTTRVVRELVGLNFCRPARHGNDIWVVDVAARTTMYAIWPEDVLPNPGSWQDLETSVALTDEGLHSYRLKALDVGTGPHIINQAHSDPAAPVFWDSMAVRIHD